MPTFDIINPFSNQVLESVTADSKAEIASKTKAAHEAQGDWQLRPFAERKAVLAKFNDLLAENLETCASLQTGETGKPIQQARNEIRATSQRIQFFLNHAEARLKSIQVASDPAQGLEETIAWEPLGVIANISAWNYPYFVGTNVFVPALLTGNAVLYKPSEFAYRTGRKMVELLHKAGLPEQVMPLISGDGSVGKELLAQDIDGVFFTGSVATGRAIHQTVADKLIKVQLELGGKDPIYVCEDRDPKVVAPAVGDGAFYNAGQSCCGVERIYVHESIYDAFVEELVSFARSLECGDPTSDATYVGPLTRHQQIAVLNDQIKDALAKGAKLHCGGSTHEIFKNTYLPSVLSHVTHEMKLMTEESFGPVIGVQAVSSDDEAVRLMNDTTYGLTAGVYCGDMSRAKNILSKVHAGSVYWNCCDRVSPNLPWSGRKDSGLGLTLSLYGIDTFLQPKAWHLKTVR